MADDARDERLAELLAVEPLDEVTRRRLVARALDAGPEAAHRARRTGASVLAAAAAIVVVIVVGLAVLVTANGGQDTTDSDTAARVPAKLDDRAAADGAAPSAGSTEESAAPFSALPDLGDLGNLDRPEPRAALRAGGAALEQQSEGLRPTRAAADTSRTFDALTCAATELSGAGHGSITAYATGTLDGTAVTAVAVTAPDGTTTLWTVHGEPCEVQALG